MKGTALVSVALAMLMLPGSAEGQEPTRVCTEIRVPEQMAASGSELFRGEPLDGECDIVVYLPLVLADSVLLESLTQATEEATNAMMLAELTSKSEAGTLSCADFDAWRDIRGDASLPADPIFDLGVRFGEIGCI